MKTPNTQTIVDAVKAEFGDKVTVGAWACRRIAGTLTWSQHSWTEARDGLDYEGNAADIFPINRAVGDQVAAFIRAKFPDIVKTVLWWVKDHFDHIHFDTWPTGIATPPCKGGGLLVKYRDGRVANTFGRPSPLPAPIPVPIPPTPPGDDTMEFIIKVLKGQTISFYRSLAAKTGVPGGNADYWGSNYVPPPGQNKPTEQEWRDAADDMFGAALQAGVFQ